MSKKTKLEKKIAVKARKEAIKRRRVNQDGFLADKCQRCGCLSKAVAEEKGIRVCYAHTERGMREGQFAQEMAYRRAQASMLPPQTLMNKVGPVLADAGMIKRRRR